MLEKINTKDRVIGYQEDDINLEAQILTKT